MEGRSYITEQFKRSEVQKKKSLVYALDELYQKLKSVHPFPYLAG